MTFYSDVAEIADELIAEFGAASTITRITVGYDPETGGATEPVTLSFPCKLAVIPFEDKFIDGTLVLTGDQQAFVSAVGLGDPLPGDVVLWRGVNYTTIKAEILAPGGTAVLYTLQIRR